MSLDILSKIALVRQHIFLLQNDKSLVPSSDFRLLNSINVELGKKFLDILKHLDVNSIDNISVLSDNIWDEDHPRDFWDEDHPRDFGDHPRDFGNRHSQKPVETVSDPVLEIQDVNVLQPTVIQETKTDVVASSVQEPDIASLIAKAKKEVAGKKSKKNVG